MIIQRGDIYYADLRPVVGSEQGGIRPVLIIQNDVGNRHSPTVICAAITSQMHKAKLPTHVELASKEYALAKDSVVLLEQLRTIDKKRLKDKVCHLDEDTLLNIMLYAIIILSILVVILLSCIGVLLYGMKNNKKTLDGILGNDDVTEEEIISMVREGHEQGTILASEAELIHNVFEFDDKEVKDIMTHRKNIVSLDGNMSFIDAIEFIIDTGKSRFPVYENDVDSIIGVLHIKDAFTFFEKNEVYRSSIKDIDGLIRPVDFIPETVNINDLFKKMQSKKSHLAMVVDEYGQISGLIAMEDILEELVGNIEDEHDEEENYIRKNDDETFIMDGMTEFSDVKEALALPVDDDAYETLNGFIISLSDKIPEEGDKTVISAYGYKFSVMSVEDKVIKQVMIKKLAPEEKK